MQGVRVAGQGLHLHPTCLPLGVSLCSECAASPKPGWWSPQQRSLHNHGHGTTLQPHGEELSPPLPAPAAQPARQPPPSPAFKGRWQVAHCHSSQVGVRGFTALLPILALGNSAKLPLPNVSLEVRASPEAGQPPLSTTSGNPSSIRMLDLWPLSNLAHPPLPIIHYQRLHSCRCVSPEINLVISGSHRSLFLDPYNFPLCLCWNREYWKSFMEEAYKIWTSVCYET